MEKLILEMLEQAKKDKKGLVYLKNAAVRLQQFELASQLRELETSLFPETKEEKDAKELSKKVKLVFAMVELNVSEEISWLIYSTMKLYMKMGGKFSIKEASELIVKRKEIFKDTE